MSHRLRRAMPGIALIVLFLATGNGPSVAASPEAEAPTKPPERSSVGIALPDGAGWGTASANASSNRRVIVRTGKPSVRPASITPSPEPARQLESATVRQDLRAGKITARVVLRGAPTASTHSFVSAFFGSQNGSECRGEIVMTANTDPGVTTIESQSGRTITLERSDSDASTAAWDCAFVLLDNLEATVVYDALIGPLTDVLEPVKPRLTLRMQKQITLKTGRWGKVKIQATNPGNGVTRNVRVRLNGKQVRIAPRVLRLGSIAPGKSKARVFKLRLNGRRAGKVTARASGTRTSARANLAVKRFVRKKPPTSGSYKGGNNKSVTFNVNRRRQVTGFRIFLQVQCGGYPDFPTYQFGYYDFPTVRIPANGKLDATDRVEGLYTVNLRGTFTGSRVTGGYFRYSGPNRCQGSANWTARRVGR